MEGPAGLEPAIVELQSNALPTWLHRYNFGGKPGTRTLNAFRHNGFQDRPTTIITALQIGTGPRIRTQINGFGDRRTTIVRDR